MIMNKNIEKNGTQSKKGTRGTQKSRSMTCNVCGTQINQLYKNEYLCKGCYNVRHKTYNDKWYSKFDGLYLYFYKENEAPNGLYWGYTTNFVKRDYSHATGNTALARYIRDNGLDFENYTMYILDLTPYKDSISIDDVLLLEHFNIANAYTQYEILNSEGTEWDFTEEQIERIHYLYEFVDMSNYVEYTKLKQKKYKLSERPSTDNL